MAEIESINGLRIFRNEIRPGLSSDIYGMSAIAMVQRYKRTLEPWNRSGVNAFLGQRRMNDSVLVTSGRDNEGGGYNVGFKPTDCDEMFRHITGCLSSLAIVGLGARPAELDFFPTIVRPQIIQQIGTDRALVQTMPAITVVGTPVQIEAAGIDPYSPTVEQMAIYADLTRTIN